MVKIPYVSDPRKEKEREFKKEIFLLFGGQSPFLLFCSASLLHSSIAHA